MKEGRRLMRADCSLHKGGIKISSVEKFDQSSYVVPGLEIGTKHNDLENFFKMMLWKYT